MCVPRQLSRQKILTRLTSSNYIFEKNLDPLTPAEAAAALALGTWRLRSKISPVISTLAAQIESIWRVALGTDLGACPLPQRLRYLDTMTEASSDGDDAPQALAYFLPDPPRDDPGWPRLQVENRAYASYAFRKLHLELAVRQDGLHVLHCVMYPRMDFDLPILSIDVVAVDGKVTFAIADPCPVTARLTLPGFYSKSVE